MKVKLDFITNSSTTCFVVIGNNISLENINEKYYEKIAQNENTTVEQLKEDPHDFVDSLLKGSELDYTFGEDYYDRENVMIGIPFTKMNDDETLKQFKQRVQLQMLERLGINQTPQYIEEAGRDG